MQGQRISCGPGERAASRSANRSAAEPGTPPGRAALTLANGGYLSGEAERAADWIVTCCRAWLDVLRASPMTDAELAAAAATAVPAGQDARK